MYRWHLFSADKLLNLNGIRSTGTRFHCVLFIVSFWFSHSKFFDAVILHRTHCTIGTHTSISSLLFAKQRDRQYRISTFDCLFVTFVQKDFRLYFIFIIILVNRNVELKRRISPLDLCVGPDVNKRLFSS